MGKNSSQGYTSEVVQVLIIDAIIIPTIISKQVFNCRYDLTQSGASARRPPPFLCFISAPRLRLISVYYQ